MKKLLVLVLLAACSLGVSYAQTTAVSATVVDSDSTTWANGTWIINFKPGPGFFSPSQYAINGAPLDPAVYSQSGTMNGSGAMSVTVYNSSIVTPVGSGWTLLVCPNASVPCSTYQFSTAGASQNISSALTTTIIAPRFRAVSGSYGYNDTEAQLQLIVGSTYYSVTTPGQRCYSGTAWAACSAGGAGGLNQLTGDVTAGPGTGSQVATLATVNSSPGACGDATHVCQATTNGKGLVTAQTPVAITAAGSGLASLGNIYSASTWASLAAFTQSGATPSIVAAGVDNCPAGTNACLEFTGGTNSSIASLDVNYYTTANQWTASVTDIVGTKGATSYGLGLGLRPWSGSTAGSGVGFLANLDMTNTGTSGQLSLTILNSNTPTTGVNTSLTSLTLTAGDKVVIQITRFYDFIQATAYDLTTGAAPVTTQAQYTVAGSTSPAPPTVSKFAIFNQGGTQTVTSLTVNSQQYVNVDIVVMGDSKALSDNPAYTTFPVINNGTFGLGWANLLGTTSVGGSLPTSNGVSAFFNGTGLRIVNESSAGAVTADGLNWLPEVLALKPKVVIYALGRNDIATGVPSGTWQANYSSTVSQLQAAGITVYLLPVIYETAVSQVTLAAYVAATYSNSIIIPDPLVAWSASSSILNIDNIHPTTFGHSIVAQGVANFLISKQVGYNYVPYPMVPTTPLFVSIGQYQNYNHQLQVGTINQGPALSAMDSFALGSGVSKAGVANSTYGHIGQSTDALGPNYLEFLYTGSATQTARSHTIRIGEAGVGNSANIIFSMGGTLALNSASTLGFNAITTGQGTFLAVPFTQAMNQAGTTGTNITATLLGWSNEASAQTGLALFFNGNATAALRKYTWQTRVNNGSTGILGLQDIGGGDLNIGAATSTATSIALWPSLYPKGNFVASGRTTAVTATTLVTTTATSTYLVEVTITCDTSVATATVIGTLRWTDPSSTAQSVVIPTATCTTLGAASYGELVQTVRAKTGTTITIEAAIANSPNYDITATAIQRTSN